MVVKLQSKQSVSFILMRLVFPGRIFTISATTRSLTGDTLSDTSVELGNVDRRLKGVELSFHDVEGPLGFPLTHIHTQIAAIQA